MMNKCKLRMTREDYDDLIRHLYPGDDDEHSAILLAGVSQSNDQLTLHVREVHPARDGIDYTSGDIGYRALAPTFIHRFIIRARDEKLAYLAVHNHDSDRYVNFSTVDIESHERGYPALLQIARSMPVGALVFGRSSIEADIWLADGSRLTLDRAIIVGNTIQQLTPSPTQDKFDTLDTYDRQIRMFGKAGQVELSACRVGIIGLGGIGSLVAEYLARLGVRDFYLVDNDNVEVSNLSRIVGASRADALAETSKLAVADRVIRQANHLACTHLFEADVTRVSIAKALTSCDYLFLAADSMRARLVFNALVHQYLIPGVQLGAKIRADPRGSILDVMSANRPVRPGYGCLWCNQLIDPHQLAKEWKTDEEIKDQAYGVEEPNPSVISVNAIAASHGVNDFLLNYLSISPERDSLYYEQFHHLRHTRNLVQPRKDNNCPECSRNGSRFGMGDLTELPCIEE